MACFFPLYLFSGKTKRDKVTAEQSQVAFGPKPVGKRVSESLHYLGTDTRRDLEKIHMI